MDKLHDYCKNCMSWSCHFLCHCQVFNQVEVLDSNITYDEMFKTIMSMSNVRYHTFTTLNLVSLTSSSTYDFFSMDSFLLFGLYLWARTATWATWTRCHWIEDKSSLTSDWASLRALSRSLYRAALPNFTSNTRALRPSAPFLEMMEPVQNMDKIIRKSRVNTVMRSCPG